MRILHREGPAPTLYTPMARLSPQFRCRMARRRGQTRHTMGTEWSLCLGRALGPTLMNHIQGLTDLQQGTCMHHRQERSLFRSLRSADLQHFRMRRKTASTACMVSNTVSPSS
jgi:hypothetical protein